MGLAGRRFLRRKKGVVEKLSGGRPITRIHGQHLVTDLLEMHLEQFLRGVGGDYWRFEDG